MKWPHFFMTHLKHHGLPEVKSVVFQWYSIPTTLTHTGFTIIALIQIIYVL